MSWKETFNAKQIKKNMFVRKSVLNDPYIIKQRCSKGGTKSRMIDENGVCKTNIVYEISSADFKPLVETWCKTHKKQRILCEDLPDILGLPANEIMIFYLNEEDGYKVFQYQLYSPKLMYHGGWFTDDPFTVRFALSSDLKELPLNSKEKEAIDNKDKAKRKLNFNNMLFKDNIIDAFKKYGYHLHTYDGGLTYILDNYYNDSTLKGYNQFIEEALDYYINHIVKDLGCKITIPKPSSKNRCRESWDTLISMTNIDMIEPKKD